MTPNQALLISMLLGRALDAILSKIQGMSQEEIYSAIKSEENRTSILLEEMRNI